MLLYLIAGVLVVWTVVYKYRRWNLYKLASMIPAPTNEWPMIGVAHTLSGSTEDIMASLQKISYEAMDNDGMIKVWLGHILYFVVVNPLDLDVLMKTCLEKDDLHRFIRKIIGNGTVFAPVSIWRKRRKVLVPAFSPKIVESFVDVFSEQSVKLTKQLEKQVDKGPFSLWPFVSTYTLDSVCETAMGVKMNAQENPDSPFLICLNRILNLVCKRIFHLWLQPEWLFKLFPQYIEHQKCLNEMHEFVDKVIKMKRADMKTESKSKPETDKVYDLGQYKMQSFLDLLVTLSGGNTGGGYTDIELREEVLTLTIAGTDTSAVAIGYVFKLLAKYPDVQEKVYQELCKVFGDSNRPVIKEDLPKLKYLERVVKETLRLFLPVPFVIRKVLNDIALPSGRVLPAGSGVGVSIWGVHRDPHYWGPDAEHFDPDRFLPERFNLAHTCSYMPFSSGPRNCPGYQYALMSMKTALSTILRSYKVVGEQEPTTIPHIRVKIDIMMKDADGYCVALERRMPTFTKKK
ncbi:cytochrome P450 4C1-like isoform X2 [Galleria mellonella]|uniref:Cytochrome P450 4C1-like isoform X2 n=1 Tax=Galleria mellonella TaxID=7137 RepID=A0A6J1WC81_GALME|nr:cytochrome P450 4C1-like isoform X2 [Galleria mellonella]